MTAIHDTIAQIEALEAKATPGNLQSMDDSPFGAITEDGLWFCETGPSDQDEDNAALIVALRNAAPSLIAYIRALEKVRDSAKEAIQRERMDETYGADLSEIEYAVQDCDALAAGDRLLGRIDDVFDEKVTIQTAVNNGCSLSIDSNAYLIADMQPRLVEQLNRIESKLNDVAASREEAK